MNETHAINAESSTSSVLVLLSFAISSGCSDRLERGRVHAAV